MKTEIKLTASIDRPAQASGAGPKLNLARLAELLDKIDALYRERPDLFKSS